MSDGLKIGKVHGHVTFIRIIDGKPHLRDTSKGKLVWTETIMEESRIKKFKPISELEMIEMIENHNKV